MKENEVKRKKFQKIAKQIKKDYALYLFLLPTVIWFILFCYVPMGGILGAFYDYYGIGQIWDSKFVGLKWFKRFFTSVYAPTTIINTLRLSLYSMAVFVLPIAMAVLLNVIPRQKFKKIAQTIMYAPHFVSLVVMVNIITLFLDSKGIVNNLLALNGFDKIDFMGSPQIFPHLFVWSDVWQSLGWNCIIYIAALSAVDPGLHEAAKIDGCSRMKAIWYIDLPSIAPTIIIMMIMRVGKIMTVSTEKTLLFRNSVNMSTSETIGTYVYNRGLVSGELSYSTAVGLFLNVTNLLLLLLVNSISRKVSDTSLF